MSKADSTKPTISLAIETSCRAGAVALGRDDALLATQPFDAEGRSSTHLVAAMDQLLGAQGLTANDVDEVYISAGPGSFTGVRVGVTVARTLAQAIDGVQLVPVATSDVVAHQAAGLEWDHLAVILDAGDGQIYVTSYQRTDAGLATAAEAQLTTPAAWLATAPRPILLTGEGLGYHTLEGDGIRLAPDAIRLPTIESLWQVGRALAKEGQFVEYHHVLPIYARPPHAVTALEKDATKP
jgi:tRNA threonylcarbamoyladenosine biosynthesis protein TsaB